MDMGLQSQLRTQSNNRVLHLLLVDDHIIFRKGIAALLKGRPDVKLVGEAGNGSEAIEAARQLMPDVILMDLRMSGMDGFEATRIIKKELPSIKIIILTISDGHDDLFTSIQLGADGYLPKCFEPQQLFEILDQVKLGETAFPSAMATKIVQDFSQAANGNDHAKPSQELSTRELEVLRLVARGDKNKEIADTLEISENTVKNHIRSILEKLSVRNRIQAAVYAVREGII
ncbi:MAG TPA: response regulator transcription factor [Anaerolineae bacterium]|nr:response regulator transcription factor [Anaerolineae bacterium]